MRTLISLLFMFVALACTERKELTVSVANSSSLQREYEIVELDLAVITERFNGEDFIITNPEGKQIPYQLTHDKKIIFPVSLKAHEVVNYSIKTGKPDSYKALVFGKYYPERVDDIAWENDKIAFRTYGPTLQASGEKAFGYDVWVKRVPELVVEQRYATELNPETRKKIEELRKTDPEAAQELANSVSYHIDHGNGLDFYSVGPTLGGGTSALLANDSSIIYPYCYKTYEIVDNGPLRFTVRLTYNPLTVNEDTDVIETRTISLDAGSQLNKITVKYTNLSKNTPIVTGIVMHEPSNDYQTNTTEGFIAYAAPADPVNGQIYVGAVIPSIINEAKAVYFSDKEKTERKANGHVLAFSDYTPGGEYVYYTGGGWNKWGFENSLNWFNYVSNFSQKVREPLSINIQ
ncbi:hypothetical protein M2459_002428 [Parabacteroides sp. PF5-5]|uniref:DUF4861 domain-containing protein n=1 Tax=unclassified Parabacteroides TaxID=2649774 RepID=UPI0024749245|nr:MULTISPECIES: DUF4861 domain-containing protein [unclassified Parabacteroides]MDH6316681.1 hypothetical protein [Parabacteroides sp. PF5-13]MDH6327816.1 hypothetical protein [Parabacteroides sp. PH5-41]MDH6335668.1 hypothetical protein [Parabacteroides sp. PF5-5]MDH6346680.1 hypothetical protein [Parabacteroides sp. PH5-46]MDH6361694.1 hypothetical protein [Parabacteroides sp. PH5-16]